MGSGTVRSEGSSRLYDMDEPSGVYTSISGVYTSQVPDLRHVRCVSLPPGSPGSKIGVGMINDLLNRIIE